MTTANASPSARSISTTEDYDALGVIYALERTCELESRLRQAIQQTHPLTTTLDWDFDAADREREALLAIRLVFYIIFLSLHVLTRSHVHPQ